MFESFLNGIRASLSLTANNSPISKSVAKSQTGNSVSSQGDNCHVAGRDININFVKRNAFENAQNWNNLKDLFTEKGANYFIGLVEDPRNGMNFDHNINGYKKFVNEKFEKASFDSSDAKAQPFLKIAEWANQKMDVFVRERDPEEFKKQWLKCGELLEELEKED